MTNNFGIVTVIVSISLFLCSVSAGVKYVSAETERKFQKWEMEPISNYGNLTIFYRVASAPIKSGAIKRFLTNDDLDDLARKLLPRQYYFVVYYRQALDRVSLKPQMPEQFRVFGREKFHKSDDYDVGGFHSLPWIPENRMMYSKKVESTLVVSPGVVPIPSPAKFYYGTWPFVDGELDLKLFIHKRSGNVFPRLAPHQSEFFDCWEYEANNVVTGGKIKPKIWIEKDTGIVLGGFGDFANPKSKDVIRKSWILDTFTSF